MQRMVPLPVPGWIFKAASTLPPRPRHEPDGWLITGTRVIDVMPETLTGTRQTLTQIAVERKALYLGWQIGGRTAQDAQPTA